MSRETKGASPAPAVEQTAEQQHPVSIYAAIRQLEDCRDNLEKLRARLRREEDGFVRGVLAGEVIRLNQALAELGR